MHVRSNSHVRDCHCGPVSLTKPPIIAQDVFSVSIFALIPAMLRFIMTKMRFPGPSLPFVFSDDLLFCSRLVENSFT